jgi:hypothetical protein
VRRRPRDEARRSALPPCTRVRVVTRVGSTLVGRVVSEYRPPRGVDFQPDVGHPIYLPSARILTVEALDGDADAGWAVRSAATG